MEVGTKVRAIANIQAIRPSELDYSVIARRGMTGTVVETRTNGLFFVEFQDRVRTNMVFSVGAGLLSYDGLLEIVT